MCAEPTGETVSVGSGSMDGTRKVSLRVTGRHVTKANLRRGEKELELVITDPLISEFVIDERFKVELRELIHPHEIRTRLPTGGWRKVSLRTLIALLRSGTVHVAGES